MHSLPRASCIILSAGESLRMMQHKALLKFDAGTTFIHKITETYYLSGIEQLIVVLNEELYDLVINLAPSLPQKVQFVVNLYPERGRFFSLQTGLQLLNNGNYCFFQNIDNPFTSAGLLEMLYNHRDDAEVIIPSFENKPGHPVLLSPKVVQEICTTTDPGLRINDFLRQFHQQRIETPDNRILTNINSPEDYRNAGFPF